ncbi:MAG: sodium:solute symporter family protein [Luteibaculaceae bacterium]
MILEPLDWGIITLFFVIVLGIGVYTAKSAGKNSANFFLGNRNMPWWLLGVSMVATTFSADTPNLVTGFVREGGVSKNWLWWSFLITGLVTVFLYAKLWRRSNLSTDLGFYELRYQGKIARFLRGFRALYLGLFFNCLIMGSVTLAAIKIGGIMFGANPLTVVLISSVIVIFYSALGGFKGVIYSDFFQFIIALGGAIYAAKIAIQQPEIGSLQNLINHPLVQPKTNIFPDFSTPDVVISMFIIPLAVQWWAVWYPGAEPGGGGYIAQRMLAAKDEKNALSATLLFNIAHYAVRPWPWIIVGLASLIIYPNLSDLSSAFPHIDPQYLADDLAYPAMLTLLNPGWLGLITASLLAAFLSTLSTHLNWGSSYLTSDFYKPFINPKASEKTLVLVGRISTALLMILSAFLALFFLENASQAFNILLLAGAGSGGLFLLRWFWWRINAVTELVSMIASSLLALLLILAVPDSALETSYFNGFTGKLLCAVALNTLIWVSTALLTQPESDACLKRFYITVEPNAAGWSSIIKKLSDAEQIELKAKGFKNSNLSTNLLMVLLTTLGIYGILIATGNLIYGHYGLALAIAVFLIPIAILIIRYLKKH